MNPNAIYILLADDDKDDCLLFSEALEELPISTNLSIANDGEQLMILLQKEGYFPTVLFLDLNMPRKNGLECLAQIKLDENLRHLPVIVFSTSFDQEIVKLLHENGALYYIRKPEEFDTLKKVIHQALSLVTQSKPLRTTLDNFVLHP